MAQSAELVLFLIGGVSSIFGLGLCFYAWRRLDRLGRRWTGGRGTYIRAHRDGKLVAEEVHGTTTVGSPEMIAEAKTQLREAEALLDEMSEFFAKEFDLTLASAWATLRRRSSP